MNNPKWRKFAPIGLYIASAAVLVAAGFYIVQQQFSLPVQIALVVAVLGLAANILLDPDSARINLTGRQARYGSNALVLTIGFIGLLVVLNYLVYQNDQRWDLTEDQEKSLAPETLDTLANLPEPVTATAYFTSQYQLRDSGEDLLKLFETYSDGNFNYEIVDPLGDPVGAEQAGVTRDGEIVLALGEKRELIGFASEQELTGGLVRLISEGERVVYFTSGHGEYTPDQSGESSYAQIKRTLEAKNFVVKSLNTLTVSSIPEDASALVVAGAKTPLSESEVGLVRDFLSRGGGLFVLAEPTLFTDAGSAPDPLADYLNSDWGVVINDDLIIDLIAQQQLGQPLLAIGATFASHPIAEGLGSYSAVFPQARSLSVIESASGISPVIVIQTPTESWGETDLAGLQEGTQTQLDQGVDRQGPLPLLVAVEDFNTSARVVVIGDADFALDANVLAYANLDLFVNTMDWVVGQEDLISLTPKATTERTLNLPAVPYMTGLIILVTIFILPFGTLGVGIAVAISRRKRL